MFLLFEIIQIKKSKPKYFNHESQIFQNIISLNHRSNVIKPKKYKYKKWNPKKSRILFKSNQTKSKKAYFLYTLHCKHVPQLKITKKQVWTYKFQRNRNHLSSNRLRLNQTNRNACNSEEINPTNPNHCQFLSNRRSNRR